MNSESLVTENMGLVYYLATGFKHPHVDYEELVSVGSIGLFKASRTFDRNKGVKFSTYAGRCIKNEMLMELRKRRDITSSLDDPVGQGDGKLLTVMDTLPSDECVEDRVNQKLTAQYLRQAIATLPPHEQFIVNTYYGIGCNPMVQREIGVYLGISQSNVTRLLKVIENKLRRELEVYV